MSYVDWQLWLITVLVFEFYIETFQIILSFFQIKSEHKIKLLNMFKVKKDTKGMLIVDVHKYFPYRPMFLSYRNQSICLLSKSIDWYLYVENVVRADKTT